MHKHENNISREIADTRIVAIGKEYSKWVIICLILGTVIGSMSAFFLIALQWATDNREANTWIIAFLPFAGLSIGMLYYYYGQSVEKGNNIIIDEINAPQAKISLLMAPFVFTGTIVSHLFGGSVGREGTALQMSASIADQLCAPFGLSSSDRKTLLMAAIAAGFGSVFSTPITGALFALEVCVIGRLNYKSILPAIVASFIANGVTHWWGAPHTTYTVLSQIDYSVVTIICVAIAGILFGLTAKGFSLALSKLTDGYKTFIKYPPLRALAGGLIVALAVYAIGTTKYIGLGLPTIIASFEQQLPYYDFGVKFLFTVVTLAAGFKGGEVTPLFFIGATLGNALSLIMPVPFDILAGVGFVAVFAGATNTPIACTVMAMELFGVEIGALAALACVLSYFASGHTSIYSSQVIGRTKYFADKRDLGRKLAEL